MSTIILNLQSATNYEVHILITDPSGVINGEDTIISKTLSLSAPSSTGNIWYIVLNGDDTTGDGSASNPWKSMTRASQSTSPGDTVIINGGLYSCNQLIINSGNQSAGYIIYRAAAGQIPVFDYSDPLYTTPNVNNYFTSVVGRPGVFSTPLS